MKKHVHHASTMIGSGDISRQQSGNGSTNLTNGSSTRNTTIIETALVDHSSTRRKTIALVLFQKKKIYCITRENTTKFGLRKPNELDCSI